MLKEIYKYEIQQIVIAQDKLFFYEQFLNFFSEFIHPAVLIFYIIPITAAYNLRFYSKLLITATTAEYTTIFMKWCIAEYRPYWWVQETDAYIINRPILRQTKLTCEATSGFPSGHLMFSAAVFYTLCKGLERSVANFNKTTKLFSNILIWSIFVLIIIALTLSRMYFGCHFFHQCLFGAVFGVTLAVLLETAKVQRFVTHLRRRKAIGIFITLTAFVFAYYWIQKLLKIDPQWSIKMAFKWCENPYFVKPTSTIMYGFSRDLGAFFGMAFASPMSDKFTSQLQYKKSFTAIIILIVAQNIAIYFTPTFYGYIIYYSYTFFISFLFVYLYLVTVPRLCRKSKTD